MKRASNIKNKRVEEALFKLATGFTTEELRETTEEDASGKIKLKTERIRKDVPPDMKAILEWLRNRSDGWIETEGQTPVIQVITSIPRPEITTAEDIVYDCD